MQVDRSARIAELRKIQLERMNAPVEPIRTITVEGQIPFSEYGAYNDRMKRELDEVQRLDMIEHCKNWKPESIPEMNYPEVKMTPTSLRALFACILP